MWKIKKRNCKGQNTDASMFFESTTAVQTRLFLYILLFDKLVMLQNVLFALSVMRFGLHDLADLTQFQPPDLNLIAIW